VHINFGPTLDNLGVLFTALRTTVTLFGLGFGLSIVPAALVAVLRVHGPRLARYPLVALVYAVRGVPAVLSVIIIFYALPFLGLVLGPFECVLLTLVIVQTVYVSEVFRSALEAITKGQFEAGAALGLTTMQTLRLVIFPQAALVAAPAFISSAILLMHNTTIAQGVGLYDLLGRAQNIAVNTLDGSSILLVAPVYALILVPLVRLARRLEARLARRTG
jgi:polar amino acid transport system permease protein